MRSDKYEADLIEDYLCQQHWEDYTKQDHAVWKELFNRQSKLLVNRAAEEYLKVIPTLGLTDEGIPDFRRMSEILHKATGWTIITVKGLISSEAFHGHLSRREFPVTYWIRKPEEIDYIAEPDIFHDLFGHVPMLMNPVFADYVQAFGMGGVKADNLHYMTYLEKLYWYTVEFGLINTKDGLRIYGSGIVSSKTESIYCLEDKRPHRIGFDLKRTMRTDYRYDKLQECYFVIDSFEQLFEATRPDFTPIYEEVSKLGIIEPYKLQPEDKVFTKGTVINESH